MIMARVRFLILFIVLTLAPGVTAKPYKILNNDVPEYLYHWTTVEGLEKMVNSGDAKGIPQSFSLPQSYFLSWYGPNQAQRGTLFTFINPTAVAGASSEEYGNILVRLKIDRSKVIAMNQPETDTRDGIKNKEEYNYSHHANLYYSSQHNEWIVLNPEVISSITADPINLKEDIERELAKLKSDYNYLPEEVHFLPSFMFNAPEGNSLANEDYLQASKQNRRRWYTIHRLEQALRVPRDLIPVQYMENQNDTVVQELREEALRRWARTITIADSREKLNVMGELKSLKFESFALSVELLKEAIATRFFMEKMIYGDFIDLDLLEKKKDEFKKKLGVFDHGLGVFVDHIDRNKKIGKLVESLLKTLSREKVNIYKVIQTYFPQNTTSDNALSTENREKCQRLISH